MKSYLRKSKASKSTLRKIEDIVRHSPRETRRAVSSCERIESTPQGITISETPPRPGLVWAHKIFGDL
jgi:hypothetical protein